MKTFERILKEELLARTSHLLDGRQHGFLMNRSCTTNMVNFVDSVVLSINDTKSEAEYKSYRNVLRNIKRKAYEQYYREKIEKYGHDKSKTWGLINEISKRSRRKKASIKCLKGENGSKINTAAGIANRLNNHFSSVGQKMADAFENLDNDQETDPIHYISTDVDQDFVLRNTNCDEVTKKIKSLDEKK